MKEQDEVSYGRDVNKLPRKFRDLWWKVFNDELESGSLRVEAAEEAWRVVNNEMQRIRRRQ